MKPFAFFLAICLTATTASAYSFNLGTVTPTLTFPEPKSDGETVSKDTMSARQ